MRIHLVQLEPLKERYTEWWSTYIPERLKSLGIEVNIIQADTLTTKVESGTVLDACGTNYYKAQQIKTIAEMFHEKTVQPYDRFLVTDIWFPGVEAIKYMSHHTGIPVKIFGVWHAGSITDEDFMQPCHEWAKFFELGYLSICDGIFVGSEYSKESILQRLLPYCIEDDAKKIASKIHAQGMPLDIKMLDSVYYEKKEPRILFPNRFDIEKRPNIFMDAIEVLASKLKPKTNIEICFCTSRKELHSNQQWLIDKLYFLSDNLIGSKYTISVKSNLSKKAYYELLASSSCMVSTTIEENFGYCLAESLALGTMPIVPKAFSHPEILDGHEEYMYESFDELTAKIAYVIGLWDLKETNKLEEMRLELKNLVIPYDITVTDGWVELMK